jgi:alpha-tubulin suppressor-like RCC1 family protein
VAITPEDIISWGGNSYGQCGQGERAEVMSVKPRSIKPLQGISVAQIVCGRYHTLCVSATSQVRPAVCRAPHFQQS